MSFGVDGTIWARGSTFSGKSEQALVPAPGFGVGTNLTNYGTGLLSTITNTGVGVVSSIIEGFGVGTNLTNRGIGKSSSITNDGIGKETDLGL